MIAISHSCEKLDNLTHWSEKSTYLKDCKMWKNMPCVWKSLILSY